MIHDFLASRYWVCDGARVRRRPLNSSNSWQLSRMVTSLVLYSGLGTDFSSDHSYNSYWPVVGHRPEDMVFLHFTDA